jgi:hypothetical protein
MSEERKKEGITGSTGRMSVFLSLITDGKIPDHDKTDSPIGYQFRLSNESRLAIGGAFRPCSERDAIFLRRFDFN